MIPLSVIDALIQKLEDAERIDEFNYYSWNPVQDVILTLKEYKEKKEAIPPPSNFDYTMINEETAKQLGPIGKPMHEQDKSLQEQGLEQKIQEINDLIAWNLTPSCNEAKKKLGKLIAEQSGNKTITTEQRIRDRIKHLKENLKTAEGAETFDIDSRIDELEELIPY